MRAQPVGAAPRPLRHHSRVSGLRTFEDFDRVLAATRAEIARMAAAEPDDGAIDSVRLQLETLHEWTRGGRCPAQDEKDRLNGFACPRGLTAFPKVAGQGVA
jgi:hypothetical protein